MFLGKNRKTKLIASAHENILKHKKASFSQCGEDLIIKYLFDNLGIEKPSYLDIGAHHPYYLSNTALFYLNGCTGINIEPDPTLFRHFIEQRNLDINLNIGIGEKEEILDFYVMNVSTLNTFSINEVNSYPKEGNYVLKEVLQIKVNTVENVLKTFYDNVFPDFLTLDAEGIDEIVLKSIDYDNNKPTIICTETISFSEKGRGVKNIEIIRFLEAKGYLLYADTNINSIFISKEKWER